MGGPWRLRKAPRCRACCTRPSETSPATERWRRVVVQGIASPSAPTSNSTFRHCRTSTLLPPTTLGTPELCVCSLHQADCTCSSSPGSTSPVQFYIIRIQNLVNNLSWHIHIYIYIYNNTLLVVCKTLWGIIIAGIYNYVRHNFVLLTCKYGFFSEEKGQFISDKFQLKF